MLTGILLAGGKSKRMGKPKAFLELHSCPLISYPLRILKLFCSEIFIVTQTPELFSSLLGCHSPVRGNLYLDSCFHRNDKQQIKILTDLYTEAGPMGGIFTGLENAANRWAIVLPCDMPYVRKELLSGLVNLSIAQSFLEAIVPSCPNKTGAETSIQPLCALYSKSCLPVFHKKIQSELVSLLTVLPELECKTIHWLELDPEDSDGISFTNINTPLDLIEAEKHPPVPQRLKAFC